MSDTQMKNVGQTQPAKKPAKDQISSADQRSSPRSPISWREIRTTQQVGKNNRIACQTINFHDGSGRAIQAEIGVRFNKKLFPHSCHLPGVIKSRGRKNTKAIKHRRTRVDRATASGHSCPQQRVIPLVWRFGSRSDYPKFLRTGNVRGPCLPNLPPSSFVSVIGRERSY